jgi:hypothetical protein
VTYAANTEVPVERSRAEIERTLERYGATAFAYGWDRARAQIEFAASGRRIRFVLPLPDRDDKQFTHYSRGKSFKTLYERTPEAAQKKWEKASRQRWRALNLVIKAKLEAVEAGISEFEDEFLAHIVLPDGSTFGAWARPQIAAASEANEMPALLPAAAP